MACPFSLSADGLELQFATNHAGVYNLLPELVFFLFSNSLSSDFVLNHCSLISKLKLTRKKKEVFLF